MVQTLLIRAASPGSTDSGNCPISVTGLVPDGRVERVIVAIRSALRLGVVVAVAFIAPASAAAAVPGDPAPCPTR